MTIEPEEITAALRFDYLLTGVIPFPGSKKTIESIQPAGTLLFWAGANWQDLVWG